jgi:hypothetical protein
MTFKHSIVYTPPLLASISQHSRRIDPTSLIAFTRGSCLTPTTPLFNLPPSIPLHCIPHNHSQSPYQYERSHTPHTSFKSNTPGVYIFFEIVRLLFKQHLGNCEYETTPRVSLYSKQGGVYIFLFKHLRTFALSFKLSHMTERRKLVLDFIKAYIRLHGISPSYEVIARGIGMKSRSAIHRIVHRLQDEGYLVTKPHKFCSIRIVDKSVKEMASL